MNLIDSAGSEVEFAVNCVRSACSLTKSIEERMVSPALEKEDRSPVTVADFSVQALLGHKIATAFPEIPLVAEESSRALQGPEGEGLLGQVAGFLEGFVSGFSPPEIVSWIDRGQGDPADRFWILDPVDGTKGFLRGGQYAVALALAEHGQIQIGVIGCPHLDFEEDKGGSFGTRAPGSAGAVGVAIRGKGAWVSSLRDGQFKPLHVSECEDTRGAVALRSFESGHTNEEQMSILGGALNLQKEPILLDSQAKYLLLAAGKGDLLLRLLSPRAPDYREKIWDQAAGSIVVEEAGGRITDLDGKALDFTKGRLLTCNRGVLASNGKLHQDALAALRTVGA